MDFVATVLEQSFKCRQRAGKIAYFKRRKKVFPTLERLLSEAVNKTSKGKQRIIIIPEDLKKLVIKLTIGRWASSNMKNGEDSWSHTNENLGLFMISGNRERNRQEDIIDNFDAMKGAAQHRAVALFGTLEEVIRIGRPFSEGKEFRIKDPASTNAMDLYNETPTTTSTDPFSTNEEGGDIDIDSLLDTRQTLSEQIIEWENAGSTLDQQELEEVENLKRQLSVIDSVIQQHTTDQIDMMLDKEASSVDEKTATALPHALWWIASEGNKIQPKKSKDWDISQEVEGNISTILVGTLEEFNALSQEMSFESKFFDIEEHFEILELAPPDVDVKFDLVSSLFDRSEIRSLEYQFRLDDKNGEEAMSQLIYFLINRAEQIAIQEGQEQTSAFVRTFSELRRSLVEDIELRKSRVIDKNYLERLFARIFPLPLNPSSLRKSDPIIKLMDAKNSVREMTEIGYKGSPELKRRIFSNIVSQTRGADEGRPIPSSMIFYGDTSTGKTFFFKSLIRMLNLELYDRNRPNNENAAAIIINCGNLTEDDNSGDPTKFTVKQAIEDIKDLIAQPNGHRSYIMFDDAHKCGSDKIRKELFAFIQSFFETEDGLLRVKRKTL